MADITGRLETIDKITETSNDKVLLNFQNVTLFMTNDPIKIKVGDTKIEVSTLQFMKAFKDMLDTGEFEMDEIDSAFWKVENELEETRENLYHAHDVMKDKGWC